MSALISSGDDATYALAEHLGGGSVKGFVEKMNREAEALGLRDTRFENPVGLDARTHYSSARDLAQMARLAMRYPEFREMVGTSYASISTRYREIPLTNTNEMLFVYPPPPASRRGRRPPRARASSPRPPPGTSPTCPSSSTPERTASRPPSGRSNTASPPTTVRTSSSRENGTRRRACPTAGGRRWVSWQKRTWRVSWTRARTSSARSGLLRSRPARRGPARSSARSW